MVTFRSKFFGVGLRRRLRQKVGKMGLFVHLSFLAGLATLSSAAAQSNGVDAAVSQFQAEGLRLISVVSTGGLAVIGAGVLMVLGWAMLRKISGGK